MDPLLLSRPSEDGGLRRALAMLDDMEQHATELGAMMSQVTATSASATASPWQPSPSWSDVATVYLPRPAWAESVIIYTGGHLLPSYDTTVADVRCWGRLTATDGVTIDTSPLMMSTMMSLDVSAALTWQLTITALTGDTVIVSTQAYNLGGVLLGGAASVTAVALWMR